MKYELSVITDEGHAAMQHTKNCFVLQAHFQKIVVRVFILVKHTPAFQKANLHKFDERNRQ
jgi:hypothetical protein